MPEKVRKSRKQVQKDYYEKHKEKLRKSAKASYVQKKQPIVIGSMEFRLKKECTAYFKDLLRRSEVGDELDHAEMVDLIRRHPDFVPEWLEDCSFVIGRTLGSKNFRIINNSGSFPFSYHKCIMSAPRDKYHRKNVQAAARYAIIGQIKKFRRDNPCLCAITGEAAEPANLHVDHDFSKKTFQALLDQWAAANGGYEAIKLTQDPGTELFVMDDPYYESWCEFHLKEAALRMIKKEINLAGHI